MANEIIDVHVHYGVPGDRELHPEEAYWSPKFEKTFAYLAMRLITGTLFGKVTNDRVKKKMFKVIRGAEVVTRCVLLALDKVHDEQGQARDDLTHLYVPNHAITGLREELKQQGYDRILFGCSVHPYRGDWEAELERCLQDGAVLCKWVPSTQIIDPSHSRCIPFYRKLAQSNLPLLCHAGPELSLPTSDDLASRFNNPKYLENALDQGVKVIVPHCALPFEPAPLMSDPVFLELLALFNQAGTKGWKLYADLSALNVLRGLYTEDLLEVLPRERLLFASDYPIPMFNFGYTKFKNLSNWVAYFFKTLFTANPLDMNYEIPEGQGVRRPGADPGQRCIADVEKNATKGGKMDQKQTSRQWDQWQEVEYDPRNR